MEEDEWPGGDEPRRGVKAAKGRCDRSAACAAGGWTAAED